MKKSQFAFLIAVIVLCAGGIFGYVKYRLDKEVTNDNNQGINSSKEHEPVNKALTLDELQLEMNHIANSSLSLIEREWNLTKKVVIEDYAGGGHYYKAFYNFENNDINPSVFSGMDGGLSLDFIKDNYQSHALTLFEELDLHNLYNNNGDKFLVVCNYNGIPECHIYDVNAKEIGILKISHGALFVKNSAEKTLLSEYTSSSTDYSGRIAFGDNYIMTCFSENGNHYIYKYTISNNKLNEELIKTFTDQEVNCVQCY